MKRIKKIRVFVVCMKIKDDKLFESKPLTFRVGKLKKVKYLLREKYQRKALRMVLEIGRKLKRKSNAARMWVGGSLVKKQLGKYTKN